MLEIQSVSKRYASGHYGVRDLSLSLKGGVVGLLGPNGAGKTTLMRMLATITRPTTGSILFRGADIAREPQALRQALGYLPQDFGVYDNLSAVEFLSYFAALKGIRDKAKVTAMLERVNLHAVANRPVGGFSGGMRQRLGIAQALINEPQVVIVDEPTAGLDPEERVRFRNLLGEMGGGRLVLFSTHIVSDIEAIADRIVIMKQGARLADAAPEALLQAAQGSVWETVCSSEAFEEVRTRCKVAGAVRRADGVHVRIVGPQPPVPGATPAEPNLEDAFVYFMNFAAPDAAAAA